MNNIQDMIESVITNGKIPTEVSVAELSLILQRADGAQATFAGIVMATDAKLKKTGNPYKDEKVYKVSKYNVQLNFNYAKAVNNQLEREGKDANFEASENWHTKKYDSYNGCVAMKMEGNQRQEYLFYRTMDVKRIGFTINDKVASPDQVETIKVFLPAKSAPKNQGTDEAVIVQTVKLQNIKLLSLNGEFYKVVS